MLLEPIGGFQDADEMEEALAQGKCDFFGAARAFMADYQYGEKLYEGKGEDIVPCIKCNKCHGTILPEHDPWLSVCSVNPVMGKCGKLARMLGEKRSTGKKVAVIGGGPAGMRAALYAAEQGHQVTLFEKTGALGGQLFHSDYFSFKWPIKNYKNWLIAQLEKSTVQVVLNTAPTAQDIEAGAYDAVVAATGAVPAVPHSIEGLYDESGTVKDGVLTCLDALPVEGELGKEIIIVGGSEVGMETAMFLCEQGHNVTVLTRQKELGHNCSKLHYITMAWIKHQPVDENEGGAARAVEAPAWERYENLHGIVHAETLKVEGNTVTYRDAQGEVKTITGDRVLICGGMNNLTDEAMEYAGLSTKYFAIGDCVGAGNLQMCNEQAYASVMNL
jgi:thioredoxin reductase